MPPAGVAAAGGYPPAPAPAGYPPAPSAPAEAVASAPVPSHQLPIGEHPLAATNSPWSQEQKLSADVLPSASVLAPPEAEPAPPPPPVEPEAAAHSRTAMTIGLAVAAIALIAAVVYFTVAESDKSDDPANVKVGSEQHDYGDEPVPTPTASEAPKAAPKPVLPPVLPKAPPKPKPPEDIYENIE